MKSDEMQLQKLWNVRKTILEMCRDRGYLVSIEDLEQTKEQFVDRFGDQLKYSDLTILVAHREKTTEKLYVWFSDQSKIGKSIVRDCFEQMQQKMVSHGIIVADGHINAATKKLVCENEPSYILEHFLMSELMFNITEHKMVPKYVVLNEEERQIVLAKYDVSEDKLPKICLDDPIARYYGLQRGQMVKIIRPSETSGREIIYRIADGFIKC